MCNLGVRVFSLPEQFQKSKPALYIHLIPPWSSWRLQEMSHKILIKYITCYQNFEISLKWMKNILMYSIHFSKNLQEMKEKPPWCLSEIYHMYAYRMGWDFFYFGREKTLSYKWINVPIEVTGISLNITNLFNTNYRQVGSCCNNVPPQCSIFISLLLISADNPGLHQLFAVIYS